MKALKGMTVGELAEFLKHCDQDMHVVIARPSGDYWNHILADEVGHKETEVGFVKWSEYHSNWEIVPDEDLDPDGPKEDFDDLTSTLVINLELYV